MTDRAVSITLNYSLTLVIATLLMAGLLLSTGDILENRRESSARAELGVVGQRLAANLMTADRMAQANAEAVEVRTSIPSTVAGVRYTILVNATDDESELLMTTQDVEVSVDIAFRNTTPVERTTVFGGDIEIVLADDGDLEVRQA